MVATGKSFKPTAIKKPAENQPHQIIRTELAGDAAQPVLRRPQFFGEQVQRAIGLLRELIGLVEMGFEENPGLAAGCTRLQSGQRRVNAL